MSIETPTEDTSSLLFNFDCSCEVLPSGDFWCCDYCSSQLDLLDELVTEESDRLRGYSQLTDVSYTSEADARAHDVSEDEILAARECEQEYRAELMRQRVYLDRDLE
jgi:hypothetical protein